MDSQPRTYRIRIFDNKYEVMTDRRYVAVLDFSPGPGLRATQGQLDSLVQSIAYAAGARGPRTLDFHLVVQDAETGEPLCNWPATSWPAER